MYFLNLGVKGLTSCWQDTFHYWEVPCWVLVMEIPWIYQAPQDNSNQRAFDRNYLLSIFKSVWIRPHFTCWFLSCETISLKFFSLQAGQSLDTHVWIYPLPLARTMFVLVTVSVVCRSARSVYFHHPNSTLLNWEGEGRGVSSCMCVETFLHAPIGQKTARTLFPKCEIWADSDRHEKTNNKKTSGEAPH